MQITHWFRARKRTTIRNKLTIHFSNSLRIMVNDVHLRYAIHKSMKCQCCIPEYQSVLSSYDRKRYSHKCSVSLIDATTTMAAMQYQNYNVCVLNFACSVEPGGGVLLGSVAQEESICRRSTLFPCLCSPEMYTQFYYPHIKSGAFVGTDDCIYTPNVIVFQSEDFYPRLLKKEKWFKMSVITCSAPALNHTSLKGRSLYEIHKKRLTRILDIAVRKNTEVIVLGAFGCGAFRNDPHIVSEAMIDVIKHYRYAFKWIIFAIPTYDKNEENYMVFQKTITHNFSESKPVENNGKITFY